MAAKIPWTNNVWWQDIKEKFKYICELYVEFPFKLLDEIVKEVTFWKSLTCNVMWKPLFELFILEPFGDHNLNPLRCQNQQNWNKKRELEHSVETNLSISRPSKILNLVIFQDFLYKIRIF